MKWNKCKKCKIKFKGNKCPNCELENFNRMPYLEKWMKNET